MQTRESKPMRPVQPSFQDMQSAFARRINNNDQTSSDSASHPLFLRWDLTSQTTGNLALSIAIPLRAAEVG